MGNIVIKEDSFIINGKKTKIISGAMHYFRMFPEYWYERLKALKDLGANCVETYAVWGLHEKNEGVWDFADRLDLCKYVETAKELGLYVILRPGPYICSECDMGGLPWWLLKYDDIELRANNHRFLEKTKKYVDKICDVIKPYLITNGGNVIMIQVENEYGCFGFDKKYLESIRDFYLSNGIDVPLFTCDWESKETLSNGTLDGVYAFVNYRWDSKTALSKLKAFRPNQPAGVMELWNGKASLVGKPFPKRDLSEVESSVKVALEHGELINLYMFHGGTNFEFFNGGQYQDGEYVPHTSGYDVQAPLGEWGNKTEKYFVEQKVICDYLGVTPNAENGHAKLSNYGDAKLISCAPISGLTKSCYTVTQSAKPLPIEKYDVPHGSVAYVKDVEFDGDTEIILPEVHDFALVYLGDSLIAKIKRDGEKTVRVSKTGKERLTVFVQEFGRVNFGKEIQDPKGLIGDVSIVSNGVERTLFDWTVVLYPLDSLQIDTNMSKTVNKPSVYKFTANLVPELDTYLELDGFSFGAAYVNGFNIGRHFNVGPQKSLYVPKRLLKNGENEIIVYDGLSTDSPKSASLSGKQILIGYTE